MRARAFAQPSPECCAARSFGFKARACNSFAFEHALARTRVRMANANYEP